MSVMINYGPGGRGAWQKQEEQSPTRFARRGYSPSDGSVDDFIKLRRLELDQDRFDNQKAIQEDVGVERWNDRLLRERQFETKAAADAIARRNRLTMDAEKMFQREYEFNETSKFRDRELAFRRDMGEGRLMLDNRRQNYTERSGNRSFDLEQEKFGENVRQYDYDRFDERYKDTMDRNTGFMNSEKPYAPQDALREMGTVDGFQDRVNQALRKIRSARNHNVKDRIFNGLPPEIQDAIRSMYTQR